MELRRYLSILRRRLLLILAIVVAALAAGWLITPRTHQYTASSTLYVGSAAIGSGELGACTSLTSAAAASAVTSRGFAHNVS